jgi:hypothetical protein
MPASTIKRPRITEADQVRLDELEATINGTLGDPRPVPQIGETVWFWTVIDPSSGYGARSPKYHVPKPAIILEVLQPIPGPRVGLSVLGLGQTVEKFGVEFTEDPADGCWSYPVAGWTKEMGRIVPPPVVAPPPPPHLALIGQVVVYGGYIFDGMGGAQQLEGVVPCFARIVSAQSMDDADLEVLEPTTVPSFLRKPKNVRQGDGFMTWQPIPKRPATLLAGTMGTYLEPAARADPYSDQPPPQPVTYRARVTWAASETSVNIDIMDPLRPNTVLRQLGSVPLSDTPMEKHWTPGEHALAALKLLESVPA